jgi:hypothetical protein
MSSSLSTRIVKIPANQAGPYSNGYNRVTSTIPPNMIIDMSKSFFQIEANINTTDGDNATGEGIYNVNLRYKTETDKPTYDIALVKNCRVKSDKFGVMEETQDINHLKTNLHHLQLSENEQHSLSVNSIRQSKDRYFQKSSIFRILNGEGSDKSINQTGRIPIKLSDLYGLGVLSEIDTGMLGELDLTLELDTDSIQAEIVDSYPELDCDDVNNSTTLTLSTNYDGYNFPVEVGDHILVSSDAGRMRFRTITQVNAAANEITIDQATVGGALTGVKIQKVLKVDCQDVNNSTDIVLTDVQETLNGLPLYVGQKVQVSSGNGETTNVTSIIESITRSNVGVVTVKLADSSTNGAITGVSITPIVPANTTASVVLENVELVLYEKNEKTIDNSGGYRIYSWMTEKANGNGNQTFNDSFQLPPNCINAVMMKKESNTLYSVSDDEQDYRLVLDNNTLTDRPVKFRQPLYYDELSKWCLNGGKILKNLRYLVNTNSTRKRSGLDVMYVGTHCPETAQNKILQIEVDTTTNGLNNVNVYKQVSKVVGVSM